MLLNYFKNIRTIGIMSLGNSEHCNRFENILKEGKIQFYKVKGMYSNVEHSYFLYNIDLAFLKKWCSTDNFNQESFFLCRTKYNEETRKQVAYLLIIKRVNMALINLLRNLKNSLMLIHSMIILLNL